jgi:parallel beta-helix repeat protein
MPFDVKEKGLVLAIILVSITIFMFIISPEPQTQASLDDQPETVQFQIEPQSNLAVYTVFYQQDSYIVKNREGIIELQTEDASTAINYALKMVADQGGRVFLNTGNYIIKDTIKIHSNTILEGEAIDDVNTAGFGTRLIAASDLNGPILSNANPKTGDTMIILRIIVFDGARSNININTGSYGILLTNTTRCRIIDVAVYKCKDSGIVFDGNQDTVEAMIERVSSRGNNNAGLHMKTQSDFHIYNSEFGSNQGEGILLTTSSSGSIIGTNVFLNLRTGILLSNTMKTRLSDNRVNHNGYSGIEITSTIQNRSEYNTLTGNIIYNNGQQSNLQAGIKINSKGATISNNLITSNICYNELDAKTQDFGIIEQNGAQKNLIIQNLCKDNNLQDIKISETSKTLSIISQEQY